MTPTSDPEIASQPSRARRFLMFPVTRIFVGATWLVVAMILAQLVSSELSEVLSPQGPTLVSITDLLLIPPLLLAAYVAFVRLVERRAVGELDPRRAPAELGLGWLIGAAAFSAVVGVLFALGVYCVESTGEWGVLVSAFLASFGSATFEELAFRGVLFRIAEEALGSWIALALTAALFGLLHLVNPDATLQGAAAIVLEAGLMLGAAFMLTRRLWLVIGIHAAWNYVQGGIFGISVSGTGARGFLESRLQGPEILTGGEFGAEGSIVAVALGLAVGVVFLVLASRRGHVVRPFWVRRGRGSV
jgi:membrane protease YdiL (CAAX protease family)